MDKDTFPVKIVNFYLQVSLRELELVVFQILHDNQAGDTKNYDFNFFCF